MSYTFEYIICCECKKEVNKRNQITHMKTCFGIETYNKLLQHMREFQLGDMR